MHSTKLHAIAMNRAIQWFIRHLWWIVAHCWIERSPVHKFGFITRQKWSLWVLLARDYQRNYWKNKSVVRVGGWRAIKLRWHPIFSGHWRITWLSVGSFCARIYRHRWKCKCSMWIDNFQFSIMWIAFSQIVLLFVSACTWRNGNDSANGVDSEEASTKTISDPPSVIFEPTNKTTRKFVNKF